MPDKTMVQKPIKKTDLNNVSLLLVATEKTWSCTYTPKDETGAAIGEPRVIGGAVTADPGLWA